MKNEVEVLLVASEAYPYVKSGGMGDVVGALFKYLPRYGLKAKLFLPGYPSVLDNCSFTGQRELSFLFGNTQEKALFLELRNGNQELVVVCHDHFFRREKIYDYPDDVERFIFFSRAVFEYLVRWQENSFVLHCHDWQSALLCAYIDRYWPSYRPNPRRTIFTVHNLAYQGIARGELFRLVNLPGQFFTHEYLEFYGNINLMKAGLLFSHCITTVSPTYAREIRSPEFGEGLDGLIRALARKKPLVGIVNGIDTEVYDPATDPLLAQNYTFDTLDHKMRNKEALLQRFFSPEKLELSWPLVAFVSRLVRQKGIELLLERAEEVFSLPISWFFLGTGESGYEKALREMSKRYSRVAVELRFDEDLAHLVYGAADLLLLPSLFEPCGISQLISMRYGALPIVRRVGGLVDTVIDYPFHPRLSNGFHFENFSAGELLYALKRAIRVYTQDQPLWKAMVRNAMGSDFSWERSVEKYLEVYRGDF